MPHDLQQKIPVIVGCLDRELSSSKRMNVKWKTLSMMVPSHDTPFLWLVGKAMVLKFGCSINFSLIMCWFLPWAEFWLSRWFQIDKMKNSLGYQNRYNTTLYWPTSKHGEIGSCYTKPLFSRQLIMLIHCLNNQKDYTNYTHTKFTTKDSDGYLLTAQKSNQFIWINEIWYSSR